MHTELVSVPDELHKAFVARLLKQYVKTNGRVLITEYRGHEYDAVALPGMDAHLAELGFAVEHVQTGKLEGVEKTRVAIIKKNIASKP